MESPLTREEFAISYEYMFGDIEDSNDKEKSKRDLSNLYNNIKNMEKTLGLLSSEDLDILLDYFTQNSVRFIRMDLCEKYLMELSLEQTELIKLEMEGLITWYQGF